MNMLAIDTSTSILGIAMMKEGQIVAEITMTAKQDYSSRLMPELIQLMQQAEVSIEQLDQIIVAKGPGSYTGTRIGITTAKTLAWALQIPIVTVSSLELLAYNGAYFTGGYICPFFDARRKTVYTSLYEWKNGMLHIVSPEQNVAFEPWLEKLERLNMPILFLSPDINSFSMMIDSICKQAVIPKSSVQHLRPAHLFALSEGKVPTPVHEVVPNYLRMTEAEANWIKAQKEEQKDG